MAEFQVSDIPSDVIRSALHDLVEKKLSSKNYEIVLSSASKSGANNFIGIVYRAKFGKKDTDSSIEKDPLHSLIVKVAPQQLGHRERFRVRPLFLREIYMYAKVSTIRRLKQNASSL